MAHNPGWDTLMQTASGSGLIAPGPHYGLGGVHDQVEHDLVDLLAADGYPALWPPLADRHLHAAGHGTGGQRDGGRRCLLNISAGVAVGGADQAQDALLEGPAGTDG
ncbi:MAG: hypothetical protein GY713_09520 [Actinomycetia bacterium]|nr:hypothetical protein [Actinomycetes bacterium]